MNVLDVLKRTGSGLATVAGKAYEGYGQDQAIQVKAALARAKAAEESQRNAVLNRVALAGIDPRSRGAIAGAEASARVPAAVEEAKQLSPITTQTAVNTAKAVEPIHVEGQNAAHKFAVEHPVESFSPVVTTAPGGEQHVSSFNTKSGTVKDTGASAKAASSTAKPNESQEKSMLFYNLMKNSEPDITSTLASQAVRPAAITAYLHSSVAEPLAYAALNNDEQKLMRAMRDFSAGVLRKESGAAVTPAELRDTFARYFPAFGEAQGAGSVSESKTNARKNYMETMRQQSIPATSYYAAHDAPAGGSASHATAAPAKGVSQAQQLWDAAVAKHGEAKVLQEYGPRPPG